MGGVGPVGEGSPGGGGHSETEAEWLPTAKRRSGIGERQHLGVVNSFQGKKGGRSTTN